MAILIQCICSKVIKDFDFKFCKHLLRSSHVVCGKVMFSVMSVCLFVYRGIPCDINVTWDPPASTGPSSGLSHITWEFPGPGPSNPRLV